MTLGGALVKIAERQLKQKKPSVARIALTGAAGLGLGIPVGYGVGKAMEQVSGGKLPASVMRALVPLLGMGLGTTHALWRRAEKKAMNERSGST